MFFNDWLSRRDLYTPHRVAVVDDLHGRRYTYGDLNARANRVGAFLQGELGLQPGDRVACLATNRIEYIDLYFACGKIGAVLVPLNYRLPAAGIVELLADCRPTVLVHELALAELAQASRQADVVSTLLPIDEQPHTGGPLPTLPPLAALVHNASPAHPVPCQALEHDVAMILYTSGTTGTAKGAQITWRQIHWNVINTTIGLQLTEDDVTFLNMPLYHTGGWHVLFTPLMLLGGRVVLQQRFDPHRCNQLVGPEGVSILFGIPTMLRMMWEAENFASADFSNVRFAIFGGEPCPLPVIEAYQQRGVDMRQGYGLTEAGPNCFSLPAADAIQKQGSIGFPNFHIATRLAKDDGSDAEVGDVGELWMRGPHVFGGYWDNPAETDAALRDGWLRTGDLMTRDAEGYHYIVGRKKDMYVSGGENVYPAQVERILQQHAAVAEAAVVGVPHPKWGETGWAFVQPRPDQEPGVAALIAWCRQHLAGYQCPTKIVMMESLPLGHSGKIDKAQLRAMAAGKF